MMSPLSPLSKVYSLLQHDESQRDAKFSNSGFSGDSASFSASTHHNGVRSFQPRVPFTPKKDFFLHTVPIPHFIVDIIERMVTPLMHAINFLVILLTTSSQKAKSQLHVFNWETIFLLFLHLFRINCMDSAISSLLKHLVVLQLTLLMVSLLNNTIISFCLSRPLLRLVLLLQLLDHPAILHLLPILQVGIVVLFLVLLVILFVHLHC